MRALMRGAGARNADWLGVAVDVDHVRLATVHMGRDGRPTVRSYESHAGGADALARLGKRRRAGRLRCCSLLAAGQYQIQLIEAPPVPAAEIRQAVRWKLKDLLDYPVDQATVDVAHVPEGRTGGSRAHYLYAVSARNDGIAAQMKLFRDARLHLEAIDVPEMAQRNIATLFEDPGRGVALLALNQRGGLLTITSGGELYLCRRTEIALSQLGAGEGEGRERLVLELQRSLDHFDRQFSDISVSRLLLAEGGAEGLQAYLAEQLYLPVQRMDLGEVMDLAPVPELRDAGRQGEALHVLGAALRAA